MKAFVFRTLLFLLIACLMVTAMLGLARRSMLQANRQLPPQAHTLVLGHSYTECALQDSLLPGYINLAQSGESYFYMLMKARALLPANPHIKTVWIEYAHNQLTAGWDQWVWGDKYVGQKLPKYYAWLHLPDWALLMRHNSAAVLSAQSVGLKKALAISRSHKPLWAAQNWGGHLGLPVNKIDSVLRLWQSDSRHKPLPSADTSIHNLAYLHQLVQYCRQQGVQVYLLASPTHPAYRGGIIEAIYRRHLQQLQPNGLLNFKTYTLPDSCWADAEHLNEKGARQFSMHLASLLAKGMLQATDTEAWIARQKP